MKKFLPLLCALLCALPALAQDKDAPKEFGFKFNFEYSDETHVLSAHVGFQRELAGGKPVVFDETVEGKNGITESETLSFITETGAVLGTLSSSFDQSGHLKGQSLVEGTAPPRALNWFATDTKSPLFTVAGAALTARYTLHNGFLQQRVLDIKAPLSARETTTTYDALGRREHDTITGNKNPVNFSYVYDQNGLTTIRSDTGPDDKPFELAITRNKEGNLAQLVSKIDGVLSNRTTPLYDENGDGTGTKVESFEKGILASATIIGEKGKSLVQKDYNDGVLSSRKTQSIDEGGAIKMISSEEFDSNGKLIKRTDYNKDGTASAVTTYNADGSVKSTKKFDAGK